MKRRFLDRIERQIRKESDNNDEQHPQTAEECNKQELDKSSNAS
uniref:Uncharacterized protein n=1 Tax=Meloidogyne hapla TaxID=6305 RepID=A0A1I8BN85_MELHA